MLADRPFWLMLYNKSNFGFEETSGNWPVKFCSVFIGYRWGSKFIGTNQTGPNYGIGSDCGPCITVIAG